MGVLACSRANCESIMCDYYSHIYGYICSSCLDELSQKEINISDFMSSYKYSEESSGHWYDYVHSEFTLRE
jgi:hypothetical protein